MAAVPEKKGEKRYWDFFMTDVSAGDSCRTDFHGGIRPHEHDFQQISDRPLVQRHDGTRGGDAHSASAGIYDVTVRHVSGKLTDHYDPRTKTVNLSDAVYDSTSVAAIGVAAHECGHAVQHNTDYVPLKVRSAIVPAANLGSQLFWPLFLIGLIFSLPMLVKAGIWLFVLALAFQVVTLPVEFDASRRALKNAQ